MTHDIDASNPFAADSRCDCWVCRYSKTPARSNECMHPHFPHRGDDRQERAKQHYRDMMTERDTLRAEAAGLRERVVELWKYAAHREECREHTDGPDTCDCGLSAALDKGKP